MHDTGLGALVDRARDTLLSAEDTVCLQRARLVTEAYRRHEGEPVPIRRAKAFAHVLANMDLDLASNPVFAGNTSSRPRAWMLVPEHGLHGDGQVVIENVGLEGFLDDKVPEDLRAYWAERSVGGSAGIGHLAVDFERVVHEGLDALIDEAERHADDGTRAERVYRRAMTIGLRAVVAWAGRYARATESAAAAAEDPAVRAAHLRVAAACRRVPARPARDLFEGLQAMVLVHLATALEGHGMSISLGLPDRVLAPLVDDRLDRGRATELIAAFRLKVAANSLLGRGSKTQAITVGGLDHTRADRCNALTACFLAACDRVRVGDPHVFLRWHAGIDPAVKRQAAELLASGLSMPLLIHDEPTAQGFVRAGFRPADAWDYCVIGCNELGIPGRSAETATATSGTVKYLDLLNETLAGLPDPDAIGSASALLVPYEKLLRTKAREMRLAGRANRARAVQSVPTPFTSALMRGCIRRGRDLREGMAYHRPGLYERGLTNAANALAAIEELVFDRRELSLREVLQATESNFADGAVREKILAAPKWGNDDDRADRWACELVALRERVLDAVDAELGDPPHFVCHVIRSLHYVDGRRIGATADGRLARQRICDSIGAECGTTRRGPTAVLNSVRKLDAARYYRGGYNLNLTLSRADATADAVLSLIEGFFSRGGQELQINCMDAATLRDAQAHPERHRDLLVRISGFSARFVDLAPVEQEEIIARADALG